MIYLDLIQAKLIGCLLAALLLVINQDCPEMGFDDVRLPHVANPEEQVQAAVDQPDDGGLRKRDRVRPFLVKKELDH